MMVKSNAIINTLSFQKYNKNDLKLTPLVSSPSLYHGVKINQFESDEKSSI
jgi:hypothetical protein